MIGFFFFFECWRGLEVWGFCFWFFILKILMGSVQLIYAKSRNRNLQEIRCLLDMSKRHPWPQTKWHNDRPWISCIPEPFVIDTQESLSIYCMLHPLSSWVFADYVSSAKLRYDWENLEKTYLWKVEELPFETD